MFGMSHLHLAVQLMKTIIVKLNQPYYNISKGNKNIQLLFTKSTSNILPQTVSIFPFFLNQICLLPNQKPYSNIPYILSVAQLVERWDK